MHGRNGELCAVCHLANAVHTYSNCARKEEGATVAFTTNVTTNKYAGPYELWRRQFSPDGTIHPPARSSDADRTGICQLPPPREGRDDTKSGGTTAPQVNAEPSHQNEDWRRSAAADGPNTVDPSPASNTATNTSETRPEFAANPNEMMVPNASKKRPSFANGPRILVASNASGIMSVTCGGREHVAADNTDEVNERSATGHKSLVLGNGVAGSGFVAEGDAYGLTQRNASGHDNRPQLQKLTAQYSGSGVSPHDCFALLNDAKLALRELTVDGTVRVCACIGCCCFFWDCVELWRSCEPKSVELRLLTENMCRVACVFSFIIYILFCWFCCFPGITKIFFVPLFNGRLLHTVTS
ncbi:hypothetical protein TcBrA4_0107790 [Trypanosoma cruzi]|nr:hypothetical protein TcBrA4_0107790 [Trypanosoma cruzi]